MRARTDTEPITQDVGTDASLLFIGNATLLVRFGGFTVLTDPNFVHRTRASSSPRPLETWETHEVCKAGPRLRISAMPGRHAPGALSIALPQVMGSLLGSWREDSTGAVGGEPVLRFYITGDTIVYEGLREIAERHPTIDLAFLHLSGTRVMGLTESPLEDLVSAVRDAGLEEEHVRYVRRGDILPLPTCAHDVRASSPGMPSTASSAAKPSRSSTPA